MVEITRTGQAWWFMPVIPANQEDHGLKPWQKIYETSSQPIKAGHGVMHLLSHLFGK
jgi:hypothetical protein